MNSNEIGALHAQIFSSFINECLPSECGPHCSWSGRCFERWLLLDTGHVIPWHPASYGATPPHWAEWPKCPKRYKNDLYYIDQDIALLHECCRWSVECGVHRNGNLSARGTYLLREYTRIREHPLALRQKIISDKLKQQQGKR